MSDDNDKMGWPAAIFLIMLVLAISGCDVVEHWIDRVYLAGELDKRK